MKLAMAAATSLALALLAILTGGCSPDVRPAPAPAVPSASAAAAGLTGREWVFVSFQSSDDRPVVDVAADKAAYAVTFDPSGAASLKLDCNRGSGRWTSSDLKQPMGSLRFGLIASTMMACITQPGPAFVPDFARIAGYRLERGALYLSLEADGGIYRLIAR